MELRSNMKNQDYEYIVVESYYPRNTSGLHGPVHIRPIPDQDTFETLMHVE